MSILSVDFISLENQIERLKEFTDCLEDTNESVHSVVNSVSDMELGENDDELKLSYHRLAEAKDYLAVCILKLQRILELYNDCENSILADVDNLPLNMPGNLGRGSAINFSAMNYITSETGTFSGHSIQNDDWLEKLIF